jgi:hypothetical protein
VPLNLRWSLKSKKRNKSPGIDEIPAELIKVSVREFVLRSVSILTLVGIIKNYMNSARSQSWYLFIGRVIKYTVVMT